MEKQDRHAKLLQAIVDEYIRSAHPVSSKILVEEWGFTYSPATIRNDMAEMEEDGWIAQPHPSSGRIPTEHGYQYYVEHFIDHPSLSASSRTLLAHIAHTRVHSAQASARAMARAIADITGEMVIVSFHKDWYVLAGISYLFHKPEFLERDEMVALSDTLDHVEDVFEDLRQRMETRIAVFIGTQNSISSSCTALLSPYGDHQNGIVGILGPMRMNYEHNLAVLEYIDQLLQHV